MDRAQRKIAKRNVANDAETTIRSTYGRMMSPIDGHVTVTKMFCSPVRALARNTFNMCHECRYIVKLPPE